MKAKTRARSRRHPVPARCGPRRAALLFARTVVAVAASLPLGCAPRPLELHLTAYRQPDAPIHLVEPFDACWYAADSGGNWDILWYATRPSELESDGRLLHLLHARVLWRPVPGSTHVNRTQTNARLTYALIDVDRAISYEGSGFVFLRPDRTGETVDGEIESGWLAAARRQGDAPDPLGQCLVRGSFRAQRRPARVVAHLAELRQRLGPPQKFVAPQRPREAW